MYIYMYIRVYIYIYIWGYDWIEVGVMVDTNGIWTGMGDGMLMNDAEYTLKVVPQWAVHAKLVCS